MLQSGKNCSRKVAANALHESWKAMEFCAFWPRKVLESTAENVCTNPVTSFHIKKMSQVNRKNFTSLYKHMANDSFHW